MQKQNTIGTVQIMKINKATNSCIMIFWQQIDERVILINNSMQQPALQAICGMSSHFYEQTNDLPTKIFVEDLAVLYKDGKSSLFAVIICNTRAKGLSVLPSGTYICANCGEEDREDILKKLLVIIQNKNIRKKS